MVKYSKGNVLKFSIILKKIKVNRKTIGLIEQDQLAMLREIYAGEHSPLTDAARSRGLCAHRFSKSDGDLSTFAGRQKLWRLIDELQPEHICRPGMWSMGGLEQTQCHEKCDIVG